MSNTICHNNGGEHKVLKSVSTGNVQTVCLPDDGKVEIVLSKMPGTAFVQVVLNEVMVGCDANHAYEYGGSAVIGDPIAVKPGDVLKLVFYKDTLAPALPMMLQDATKGPAMSVNITGSATCIELGDRHEPTTVETYTFVPLADWDPVEYVKAWGPAVKDDPESPYVILV